MSARSSWNQENAGGHRPPLQQNRASSPMNHDSEHTLELLLSAIPEDSGRFRQLCHEVEDWDPVLNCALHHGLESVLHYYLIQAGFKLPPEIEERMLRWQLIRDVWQERARSALTEALQVLSFASVQVVALKGPILGERLY